MKKITILLAVLLATIDIAYAKPPKKVTVSFTVQGTCNMCKERIENALDKPGISKAKYNPSSETVTVTYNPRKLEEIQLHNLVAIAGHDTDKVKAGDQAYENLPDCCKYREGVKCDHD
ncbi:MAG: heavy-metal-associated domain-containing protein [Bacteroidetes bacterium]|nr:heavy-metal-associated domain-containing protein [Bacteroidota bacterium]